MIFYFSATGNSQWIAETIASAVGDTAVDLMKVDPASYTFTSQDSLGLVFPVYFCAAPDIVKEYARKFRPGDAYTYAVCNFSNYTGAAPERLQAFIRPIQARETGIFNDYEGETPEKSTEELAKLVEPYSATAPFHAEAIQYADKSQHAFRYTFSQHFKLAQGR